jgi:hypothetical protein
VDGAGEEGGTGADQGGDDPESAGDAAHAAALVGRLGEAGDLLDVALGRRRHFDH